MVVVVIEDTFNGKYRSIVGTKLSGPPWIRISEGPIFVISGLNKTFYCLLRNTFLQLKFKVERTVSGIAALYDASHCYCHPYSSHIVICDKVVIPQLLFLYFA